MLLKFYLLNLLLLIVLKILNFNLLKNIDYICI